MKKIPTAISLVGQPPGYATVARFCRAVESGDAPDAADMQALASALSMLFGDGSRNDRLQKFARALELYGDGKRSEPTVAATAHRVDVVVWMMRMERELVNAGSNEKKAGAMVVRMASSRFHKSETALRKDRKDLEKSARNEMAAERFLRRRS